MLKILVIEDDIALSNTIVKGLTKKGYITSALYDGNSARVADWSEFDLVLLDWDIPGITGIDLIRFKRSIKWYGSCIMLSAKNQIFDKTDGLDFGADDYISKPFEWEELYSRINACVRRRYGFSLVELDGIEWDKDKKVFYENSGLINLTETEYNILSIFFDYPSRIYSKYDIISKIYHDKEIYPDSNVIERHLSKLRKKFNYDPIQTIQNMGYRLRSNQSGKKV
jgi:DNA-binding response OmpR family regulator